jgi:hypothetical protein
LIIYVSLASIFGLVVPEGIGIPVDVGIEENTGLKFNKTPQEHSSVVNSELFSIISYH